MPETYPISDLRAADYDEILALWQACEGVGLTPAETREAIESFLVRNPGLSLVARRDGRIVGAVLCGHDGRRGYLYHLAVARDYRKQGLARSIVAACLSRLGSVGIRRATIFVYGRNEPGRHFWRRVGWHDRTDLVVVQRETPVV
jgi:ribosomal protein S18 acetylase RimI-like enzyme